VEGGILLIVTRKNVRCFAGRKRMQKSRYSTFGWKLSNTENVDGGRRILCKDGCHSIHARETPELQYSMGTFTSKIWQPRGREHWRSRLVVTVSANSLRCPCLATGTSPRTIMDSGISVVADSSSHSGGLHIPESKDGFFGYSEEKSLQQVIDSSIEWTLLPIYPDRGEILGTASRVRVPFRSRQPQTFNPVAGICYWRGRLSWGHRGRWTQAAPRSNSSSRSVKLSPKFLSDSPDF